MALHGSGCDHYEQCSLREGCLRDGPSKFHSESKIISKLNSWTFSPHVLV